MSDTLHLPINTSSRHLCRMMLFDITSSGHLCRMMLFDVTSSRHLCRMMLFDVFYIHFPDKVLSTRRQNTSEEI